MENQKRSYEDFANNRKYENSEPTDELDLTTTNDPTKEQSTKTMSRELIPMGELTPEQETEAESGAGRRRLLLRRASVRVENGIYQHTRCGNMLFMQLEFLKLSGLR